MSVIFLLLTLAYGLFMLAVGTLGIEEAFGSGWATAALVFALLFRFTLPIMVGAFLWATSAWGWHWFIALIFVSPSLLIMIPYFFTSIISNIFRRS